jgi:hypothetical protein
MKSLKIKIAALGDDHPDVSRILNRYDVGDEVSASRQRFVSATIAALTVLHSSAFIDLDHCSLKRWNLRKLNNISRKL